MPKFAGFNPSSKASSRRSLFAAQPAFIELTTHEIAGAETEINHGLGRIPFGYQVIHQPPGLVYTHGHDKNPLSGDTPWTEQKMYVRFSSASMELTIAVF